MRGRIGLLGIISFSLGASTALAIPIEDVQVTQWVGSGAKRALLVLDWQAPTTVVFGYRWDGTATGASMLQAVADAVPGLELAWHPEYPGSSVFGMGYDVDGDGGSFAITSPGVETGTASDPDDYYREGWFVSGYWGFYSSTDGQAWSYPSFGAAHTLADGGWDGWSFELPPTWSSGPPDNIPTVPEPATLLLTLVAAPFIYRRTPRS